MNRKHKMGTLNKILLDKVETPLGKLPGRDTCPQSPIPKARLENLMLGKPFVPPGDYANAGSVTSVPATCEALQETNWKKG